MPDFKNEVQLIADKLISIRRDIHAHPEMGRHEYRTCALVMDTLKAIGIQDIRICAETGVCATIHGEQSGPTIALRADMDALPIHETTGLAYVSAESGIMHACGHDIHTAALIGAAMLLNAHRSEMRGNVRLLFQPDEEGDGGAQRMIDDGAMDGVSQIFGAHTAPELKCGTVGVRYGNAYAASNPFDITIHGRGAHGAEPHLGADAITAACQIVTALQSIVSRNVSPLDSAVISIGSFHAGTARNIIADEAHLSGVIRCFGSEARKGMIDRVQSTVNGICSAMGVTCEMNFVWGYSGIINCQTETSLVQQALTDLLGHENIIVEQTPSMTTEDFGAFLEKAPGSYWHIGVASEDGSCYPLHNSNYAPDEKAIALAAAAHAQVVWTILNA